MPSPTACLLLAIALAPCQDSADSAVVIRTNSRNLAEEALRSTYAEQELQELAAGQHYVLTMDDGGVFTCETKAGNSGYLELMARPPQLLEIFHDQIADARALVGMMGSMSLGQAGFGAKDATRMISAIFDFPEQIGTLRFTMAEDPEAGEVVRIDAKLELVPVKGTWFGELIDGLMPNQAGIADFGLGDALFHARYSYTVPPIAKQLEPIMGLMTRIATKNDEQRELMADLAKHSIHAADGTGELSFDPSHGGLRWFAGLTDPEPFRKMWDSETFLEVLAQQNELSGGECEVKPNVAEHKGVTIHQLTTELDDPLSNPLVQGGSYSDFYAFTSKFSITASLGASLGDAKAGIDAALDENLKRTRLPGKSLFVASMRFGEFADLISDSMGGMFPTDDLPEHIEVDIHRTETGLGIGVRVR